jgi:hypothetical protein
MRSYFFMFCPFDDLILQILAKVIKVIAVTCHTYNQIPVTLRMLLGILQCFSINHIELDMMSVKTEIASDQCRKIIIAVLILEKRGGKLLIQESTSRPQMINLGC